MQVGKLWTCNSNASYLIILCIICLPLDILALIMHDLFGGVVYAGIDTDRYKYPIGSGRVTFGNLKSFMKAVKAGFVEIKTPKFTKKVVIGHTILLFVVIVFA